MEPKTEFEAPDLEELARQQALPPTAATRTRTLKVRKLLGVLIRGPEFLAILTVVLVLFTWKLLVATDKLDDHTINLTKAVADESAIISKEETIIHQQAIDSPPQIDLVAQVKAPITEHSAGQILFANQGSSFVSVAYAWCWGDDDLRFDVNKLGYVQDSAILGSVLVHAINSVNFDVCSGKVGVVLTPTKPQYIYTFAVYTTPSGLCRNRQQWFKLNASGSKYQSDENQRAMFPANLNQVARIRVLRAMASAPETNVKMRSDCLSATKQL